MLDFDSIIVIFVLAFIIVSLYDEIIGPAFTFVVGVVVLGLFGVLTPKEMLAGFANEQILVIIMLLLIGDVIRKTGVVDGWFDRLFRGTKTQSGFILRMTFPVAGLSAFMNNTPLVAIAMPYVLKWSKRHNLPASKLLIPLSYATILGGTATLIGTSTNLVVNGLVQDQQIAPQLQELNIFDFAWVGVPMIILGGLYLFFFSDRLLPKRESLVNRVTQYNRDYVVEALIKSNSTLVGQSIPGSGLLELKGLSLMEIRSAEKMNSTGHHVVHRIASTNLEYRLVEGDTLLFTGNTTAVSELLDLYEGIELLEVGQFLKNEQTEVIEVVVSHNSTLATKTVFECGFRRRYDAVVLGIHRNGEKLFEKTADIKIRPGDVILLLAGPGFRVRAEDSKDFYPISKVREIMKPSLFQSVVIIGGLVTVILLSVIGFIKLFMGLAFLLMFLLLTKIANPKDVVKSIDYDLGLIIVSALALGTAMIKTGLADIIANGVIDIMRPAGIIGIMAGIYVITGILAAYITTKAAAAIIFPIAITIAVQLNVNPLPFALLVAYASAATFITPHGYQTNLMVYGPGGYKFRDFFRIGLPLTILYMIVAIGVLYFVYF